MRLIKKIENEEWLFLALMVLLTTVLIVFWTDLNSVGPDETNYILIGKSILEGKYPYDFSHRLPLIPVLVSLSLVSPIGLLGARLLIPLIFMNSLLISTYIFAKELYGKKEGFIATLFVFTFPLFWRWGLSVLTDIPLAVFGLLFAFFFYRGVERDKKYLPLSSVLFSLGFLLKTSIVIFFIPSFFYFLIRKKWKIVLSKEFAISITIVPVVFFSAFYLFKVFTSASFLIGFQTTFFVAPWDISEIFKLVLAPSLLFSFFGLFVVLKRRGKEDLFVALNVLFFLLFFLYTGHLRLRYLAPLMPFMGILAGIGFLKIREKINTKMVFDTLFILILLATFTNTVYLVNLEEKTLWGVEDLSKYINSIQGDVTIASKYLPDYLKASTTKNIVPVSSYVEFDGEKIELWEFIDIVVNFSHPDNSEYLSIWRSRNCNISDSFDHEWFVKNNVDCVVLSIYEDYEKSGITEYYHPKFGPFEIPFINRPYCNGRVPPDYQFGSDLYQKLETSNKYTRTKDVRNREGQVIFIIYELM